MELVIVFIVGLLCGSAAQWFLDSSRKIARPPRPDIKANPYSMQARVLLRAAREVLSFSDCSDEEIVAACQLAELEEVHLTQPYVSRHTFIYVTEKGRARLAEAFSAKDKTP